MKDFIPIIISAVASVGLLMADPLGLTPDQNDETLFVHSDGVANTYCAEGNLITVVARTGETINHHERCG